jgi:hypothetical protein
LTSVGVATIEWIFCGELRKSLTALADLGKVVAGPGVSYYPRVNSGARICNRVKILLRCIDQVALTARSQRCNDSIRFLRVFCPVYNVVGKQTL